MELKGEQRLPVQRDRVWAALMDTETLRAAIPGCENITDEGQGRYGVTVLAAVGPVKARFKGRLQQQDLQAPRRYTLSFEGDGGMAGFARGSAEVELHEDGEAATRLAYCAQAQIGGRLAQIGSRLVDATAARMSQQFFERLVQVIAGPAAAPAAPALAVDPMLPLAAGVPPAPQLETVRLAAAGEARVQPESSMVTVSMPAWAWSFSFVVAALLAAWISTH